MRRRRGRSVCVSVREAVAPRPQKEAGRAAAPKNSRAQVGDKITARWTDDLFYRATITAARGGRFDVRFDDDGETRRGLAPSDLAFESELDAERDLPSQTPRRPGRGARRAAVTFAPTPEESSPEEARAASLDGDASPRTPTVSARGAPTSPVVFASPPRRVSTATVPSRMLCARSSVERAEHSGSTERSVTAQVAAGVAAPPRIAADERVRVAVDESAPRVQTGRPRGVLSPRGYSARGSRLRREYSVETSRGDALGCDVDIPWRRVAATPRPGRGYSVEMFREDESRRRRGWIFRGNKPRRRRGGNAKVRSRPAHGSGTRRRRARSSTRSSSPRTATTRSPTTPSRSPARSARPRPRGSGPARRCQGGDQTSRCLQDA